MILRFLLYSLIAYIILRLIRWLFTPSRPRQTAKTDCARAQGCANGPLRSMRDVHNQKQRVNGRGQGFLFQNLPGAEGSQRLTVHKKYYPAAQIIASCRKVFPSIVNRGRKKKLISPFIWLGCFGRAGKPDHSVDDLRSHQLASLIM